MKINITKTKYQVERTKKFDKQLKKILMQGKDIEKLIKVVEDLANGRKLDKKYNDHKLIRDRKYKNCRECHIEPDWLLVYKIENKNLVLLLFSTGSHSDLFNM